MKVKLVFRGKCRFSSHSVAFCEDWIDLLGMLTTMSNESNIPIDPFRPLTHEEEKQVSYRGQPEFRGYDENGNLLVHRPASPDFEVLSFPESRLAEIARVGNQP